uniref:RNase H type-1 domain-containing protein n=1 Tax=Nicotiana tabacum TaxID=4097 RepID=A0A1S4A7I6_TOBAC|nr:PREDICTED: uncharacterized protein LOC107794608 [Nicotiana tabacum]
MPKEDTLSHVFYRSLTALKVWSYFYSHAGLSLESLNLHQAGKQRSNNNKHGEAVSTNRVVYQVSNTIQSLIKLRKPGIDQVPFRWPDILRMMENYTPKLKFNKVLWELPMTDWTKINTDGASRGSPGRSSIGFCFRNEEGDPVYACGKEIQEVTNTQAETRAILEALKHCLTNEMNNIWVETDSMLLKKVITREWKPPWVIEEEVKEIRNRYCAQAMSLNRTSMGGISTLCSIP